MARAQSCLAPAPSPNPSSRAPITADQQELVEAAASARTPAATSCRRRSARAAAPTRARPRRPLLRRGRDGRRRARVFLAQRDWKVAGGGAIGADARGGGADRATSAARPATIADVGGREPARARAVPRAPRRLRCCSRTAPADLRARFRAHLLALHGPYARRRARDAAKQTLTLRGREPPPNCPATHGECCTVIEVRPRRFAAVTSSVAFPDKDAHALRPAGARQFPGVAALVDETRREHAERVTLKVVPPVLAVRPRARRTTT